MQTFLDSLPLDREKLIDGSVSKNTNWIYLLEADPILKVWIKTKYFSRLHLDASNIVK